ncbi:hypothetical protein PoB_002014500 [Plakobranchus ocellatus]|uniref:Uncharacterized protein n=1 Tax=Plakobranchus ocellatus TaxID=259542 RepID=A0AAV3ZGG9_9GAST|nr:hypothetical protein PoB_002014500 [Plakobranchus ocellatus]
MVWVSEVGLALDLKQNNYQFSSRDYGTETLSMFSIYIVDGNLWHYGHNLSPYVDDIRKKYCTWRKKHYNTALSHSSLPNTGVLIKS